MIAEVKGLAPIRGYRNLPRGDLVSLASVISHVSTLAMVPEVLEAEINPLLVRRDDVVAVDALLVLKD
jgi:succinyl-CoA synthetase beta subunit